MKTILTLIFFLTCIGAKAQNLYLEKAGKQLQTGFWFTAGGTALYLAVSATPVTDNAMANTNRKVFQWVGIGATVFGIVNTYSAFVNIHKAGKVTATPTSLTYRF